MNKRFLSLALEEIAVPAFLKRFTAFLFSICIIVTGATAQDFSNKGKDFWVGYGSHVSMYNSNSGALLANGGTQNMILYFTSAEDADVTVSIPRLGWSRNYHVSANQVTESDAMPKTSSYDARLASEGVSQAGIHITSTRPIVAYAHIYDNNVSGASLLFPTPTLGQDYYVLGFTQQSNSNFSYPFCFVIATENNTTVEITPSANTQHHQAGVPFTQVLQQGEVLNLLGQLTGGSADQRTGVDLTGTRIRSVSSGGNGCTKIAVFCGTSKLNIKCQPNGSGSADNTIQQIFPFSAWGKNYITAPTRNMPNNFFRVMVKDPATKVKLNGTPLTGLINNSYYQFQSASTGVITSDIPVLVAQFITTSNQCGNTILGTVGDPEMIYLSPVEQTINKITLNSTSHYNITSHFINVIMRKGGVASFRLDGTDVSTSFTPLPQDASYSYAQLPVSAGVHQLQSDSGFNAIAYGYGNTESYGYNAGTNVSDLYQYISIKTQYNTTNLPATCEKTPFRLSVTLPYKPASIHWDFGNAPISPNAPVAITAPQPDSSFQKDDKTLYVFWLPGSFIFNSTGSFSVKLEVDNPTPDGCSGIQEINYDVQVYNLPSIDWKAQTTGCFGDPVQFEAVPAVNGRSISTYAWDFGDGSTNNIAAPVKQYTLAGSYPINLAIITDIGCQAAVTKNLVLDTPPVAAFTISDTTCMGKAVTYNNRSTVTSGTITSWFWDDGNGTKDTLFTNASFPALYPAAGVYKPSLQVQTSTGCTGTRESQSVTIGAFPVVKFGMPDICLNDAGARFIDSSTLAGKEALSYHWRFGDPAATLLNPDTSILQHPVHKYTAAASYQVTETVSTTYHCTSALTKTFVVNGASPSAAFTITNENQLCSNQAVELQNLSSVDFGRITKLLLYWNTLDNPAAADTDYVTYSGKRYTRQYTRATTSKQVQLIVRAYSGETCMSETSKLLTLHASPALRFNALPSLCAGENNFQITTAAETGGVKGQFIYSGTGINASGFASSAYKAGIYKIKALYVSDEGCRDSAFQSLNVYPMPSLDPMPTVTVLEGGTAILTPVYKAVKPSFLWTPALYLSSSIVASPVVNTANDQQYTLTITDSGGCYTSQTVQVKVLKDLKVANVFSPNGDGIHDTWTIPYIESYPGCTIDIFNRYGQKIFSSTGYKKEWDGTGFGGPLPAGTYYYILRPGMGRSQITGSVTIIR
ncbi:PKD domain-containing protein [Filimonas effusa]|uniref:T9SS type B sorting domain-containing protein n=1 Tax=Filimonas effusa TaxID=2508721 RepID=A0A4Q1DBC8_9BACT|nr:PKD domain-containing protein [Filimonas effusa]RXK86751.1 T9SS type B sorting domain-containing protein [Filimonas effusa]